MKKDITNRLDIDDLMNRFYARAMRDETIGYLFTEVAKLNLEHHLPIIGDFWETLLFGTGSYQERGRNPLQIHRALHLKSPLKFEHFNRWLEIFVETVDETFAGTRADFIKLRATAIANRMLDFIGSVPAELV